MFGIYKKSIFIHYVTLLSGVFGTFCAFSHHPKYAIVFLMISAAVGTLGSAFFSDVDSTFTERHFNLLFKSLTKLVCFGILPVAIGYALGLNNFFAFLLFALYILASVIKLSHTSTLYTTRLMNAKDYNYHIGIPMEYTSLIFPFAYAISCFAANALVVYPVFIVLTIIAMMLKIKIPKASQTALIIIGAIGILEFILMLYANM